MPDRDSDLHEMDDESLLATARMVASILRTTGNDPNPESSADLLVELADRLEEAHEPDDERKPAPPKPGEKWTGLGDAIERSRGGPSHPGWPTGYA